MKTDSMRTSDDVNRLEKNYKLKIDLMKVTISAIQKSYPSWKSQMNKNCGWNSITKGYGIFTEGGSDVKVQPDLNMLW